MACCNLCEKKYKHGGNITNLQQHLTRKHLIFYTSDMPINQKKQRTRSDSSNDIDDSNDIDHTSYLDASSSSTANNKRRKLESKVLESKVESKVIKIYIFVSLQMYKLQVKPRRDIRIDTTFQRTSSFAG